MIKYCLGNSQIDSKREWRVFLLNKRKRVQAYNKREQSIKVYRRALVFPPCHRCEKSARESRNSHHLIMQCDNIHARTHETCVEKRGYMTSRWRNRPFPSTSSLVPLFQSESKSETFHMKMSSARSFFFMQINVIFIRMVSHLDSPWNRGTRVLGNGLFVLNIEKLSHIIGLRGSQDVRSLSPIMAYGLSNFSPSRAGKGVKRQGYARERDVEASLWPWYITLIKLVHGFVSKRISSCKRDRLK